MSKTIKFVAIAMAITLAGTSCKKNWTCIHKYASDPGNPNSPIVTSNVSITAKTKRDAKLECKSYAGPDDSWELKANK